MSQNKKYTFKTIDEMEIYTRDKSWRGAFVDILRAGAYKEELLNSTGLKWRESSAQAKLKMDAEDLPEFKEFIENVVCIEIDNGLLFPNVKIKTNQE